VGVFRHIYLPHTQKVLVHGIYAISVAGNSAASSTYCASLAAFSISAATDVGRKGSAEVSRERHSVLDEGLRPITLAIGLE